MSSKITLHKLLFSCVVMLGLAFAVLGFCGSVFAEDPLAEACARSPESSICEGGDENPLYGENGIITRATSIVAIVAGIAAVIMIIIGGFKYVTSTGDSASVNSAKNTILYAIIGLVIAMVAQSIALFVLRRL